MSGTLVWGRAVARRGAFSRLDPRTRLALLLVLLVGIPSLPGLPVVLALALASPLASRALGMPAGFTRGMLRLALIPLLFTVAANCLYGPGSGLLPSPGLHGLRSGLLHSLHFWLTWLLFSLFWATTSPDELLRSMRGSGQTAPGPMQDFRLTVELALRFAPLVGEEAERLVLAQTSRGVEWGGNVARRAGQGVGLIVPLVTSSLRRAEALADTLVARGYGSGPATRAHEYRWPWREGLIPAGAAGALALLSRLR